MDRKTVTFRSLTGEKYCGQDGCRQTKGSIEDGRLVCRAGHVSLGWKDVQDDGDGALSQGKVSKVQKQTERDTRTTLTGKMGLHTYILCYSHLLRLQCHFVIHEKTYPPELETVVKGLWTLRMPVIEQEVGSKLKSGSEGTGEEEMGDSRTPVPIYSSQPEIEDEENRKTYRELRRLLPSTTDSLGLMYIASMILRIPLGIAELQRWAMDEEMPYRKPLHHIPGDIQRALPSNYRNLLDTLDPLKEGDLHNSIRDLIYLYHDKFKLVLKPLNHPPLLLQHLQALALPLTVYKHVSSVAKKLSVDFSFPTKRETHHPDLPEIQLLALVVIATKLLYPLTPDSRYAARSETDPTFLSMSWTAWSKAHREHPSTQPETRAFAPGQEHEVGPEDVAKFTDEDMDRYMDWYAKTFVSPETPATMGRDTGIPQGVLDMFPVDYGKAREDRSGDEVKSARAAADKAARDAVQRRVAAVMGAMETRDIVPETASDGSQPLRVGEKYEWFPQPEDLSGHAKEFYERVAGQGGVSVQQIVRAVRTLERKLF